MAKEAKLVERVREHMESGEHVVASVLGTYEVEIMGTDSVRGGILIATDRRVLFYAKKMTGYDLESYPYGSIASIDEGKNMMGHKVTFYASGNRVDVKWIKDADRLTQFMNAAKSRIHGGASTPPHETSASAAGEPDVMSQLQKLGELRDAGVLTEGEFAAKKEELLKRL